LAEAKRFSQTAIISLNVEFFEQINFENFESCLFDWKVETTNVPKETPMASMPAENPTPIGVAGRMEEAAMAMAFRQYSVLDTPPVFDAATTPAFPTYNDALNSMESGLFNDIPAFDSIIESTNVISSVLDIGSHSAMNGLVAAYPAHVPASTSMDVAAQPVQSYGYDHDILMEAKEDGVINDQPMPIVRALSHDHPYVNNENEDYQILRDFLSLGHEIGVAVDVDDEELDALVSTFDFGQLGRQRRTWIRTATWHRC